MAEKFADMGMSEMAVRMNENPLNNPTVLTAILWGGTRKYSSRKLLTPDQADELMDRLDSADTEVVIEVSAALIACFHGMEKQEWIDIINGEIPEGFEDEDPEPDDEDDGDGKPKESESDEAPKALSSDSEKPTPSRSAAGKGSSKKE